MSEKSDWFAGEVDCDGNELITVRKYEWNAICEQREKFMWQVRDTCARAENAEAELTRLRARVAQLEGDNARLRLGLIDIRDEIPAAKHYATSEGCSPGDGKSAAFTSAVHIKLDMIEGYARQALGEIDGRS